MNSGRRTVLALLAMLSAACTAAGPNDDAGYEPVDVGAGGTTATGGQGGGDGGQGAPSTGGSAGEGGGEAGSGGAGGSAPAGPTVQDCWGHKGDGMGPDYDQFHPVVGSHCMGTNHQDITGIEKVVFLGDSVTAGTPPTMPAQFYRNVLVAKLTAIFGPLEVANCSAWGARTDDLLIGKQQIPQCFPGVEPKRTLVVMTVGGNDISAWAQDQLSAAEAVVEADAAAQLLREGIEWFYADPSRFPSGVFVIVGNPYEYTDGTGDLLSCPAALLAGLSGNWIEGAPAVVHFQEQFMQIAVDTGTDLVFMLENFCGHGFRHNDPSTPCYVGPGADNWFDLTCIHPNPTGHAVIADMFEATVLE